MRDAVTQPLGVQQAREPELAMFVYAGFNGTWLVIRFLGEGVNTPVHPTVECLLHTVNLSKIYSTNWDITSSRLWEIYLRSMKRYKCMDHLRGGDYQAIHIC